MHRLAHRRRHRTITTAVCSRMGARGIPGVPYVSCRQFRLPPHSDFRIQGTAPSAPVEIPPAPAAQAPIAGPAAKQFPYPGETVPAPVAPLDQGENRRNDSSSSSSRSPETDSPADNRVPEVPPVRRRLPKPERVQSDEDREAEDLSVAKFYRQSGNPNAAYLRTKDAVKLQADDPEAHFALAQLALQLGKREEAAAEYASYLKLDPDGDNSRAAQKALTLLGYQK